MPFVQANGIKIHYERNGGGPTLLFLHGMTDNWQYWLPVTGSLGDAYDMLMLDARGHGLSEAPGSGYTYADMAADVVAAIGEIGLQRACLIGHSMGAMTAAVAAAQNPDLVSGLVLEDPPWAARPASPDDRALHAEHLRRSIEHFAHSTPAKRSSGDFDPWLDADKLVSPNIVQLIQSDAPPWREIVTKITCPTLLITADPERGSIVTPQVAQEAARLNKRIQVLNIAGAGHLIRRERFGEYMAGLHSFLAGLGA